MSQAATEKTFKFLFDFLEQSYNVNINALSSFPSAIFLFMTVFLTEPLIGIFNVKALFLLGYILLLLLYYSIGVMLIPTVNGEKSYNSSAKNPLEGFVNIETQRSLIPFTDSTYASFYCIMMSFIISYFMALNIHYKIYNWRSMLFIYTLLFIVFVSYYMLVIGGEFQSTIMSLCAGICFGIFWAVTSISGGYLTYGNFNNRSSKSHKNHKNKNKNVNYDVNLEEMILQGGNSEQHNYNGKLNYRGDNQNENMICRAYRM